MFRNFLKTTQDFSKIWIVLLSVVAIVLLIVGLAFIIFDKAIIYGRLYIITALLFGAVVFLITRSKIAPNLLNLLFSLGFIFSIIGLAGPSGFNLNIGIWVWGISLLILGIISRDNKAASINQ